MMAVHGNRKAQPYDEDTVTKSSVSKDKGGQHEPPAKYNGELIDPLDDIETRGIVPLDPLGDDDDSVVLPDEDRYSAIGPRDPAPTGQSQKKESLPKFNASKESSIRKQKEPEAFTRAPVKSFQTMDMDASVAMTEAGGCINLFDAIFLCVGGEEELQKVQTADSEYSEFSDDQGY